MSESYPIKDSNKDIGEKKQKEEVASLWRRSLRFDWKTIDAADVTDVHKFTLYNSMPKLGAVYANRPDKLNEHIASFNVINFLHHNLNALLNVSMAARGMLNTIATGLAIDAYDPVSHDALGIAGMSHRICERTQALDAAGNINAILERFSSKEVGNRNDVLGFLHSKKEKRHNK
ncbi:H(+)-exporting diphosphatase [Abeliophyllum distichum]|uniref:H(+)-exporting diphosphatase n=1 Tax=Abeliophyllum distichum TaxID=126358 RepID=A0ABD1W1N5_9LAMI